MDGHERQQEQLRQLRVWLVVPMFRVTAHIGAVLRKVPPWVEGVVCVDDCCPERSGDIASVSPCSVETVILRHEVNQGVGGAVLSGYRFAESRGAKIIVKVDGDDQMDLRWLGYLVQPIAAGQADYTKGNRFSTASHVEGMPPLRIFGNSVLSLMSKFSSGYWKTFDPTNGYTAISARVVRELLGRRIAHRYFFESDMLYHLGSLRAVVRDIPMPARYADERSNLNIMKIALPFMLYHMRNSAKRFVGQYIVRDFNVATLEVVVGLALLSAGLGFGVSYLFSRPEAAAAASAGVVMLAALPVILGVQLLLAALNFDVLNVPKDPIHPMLLAMDAFQELSELDSTHELPAPVPAMHSAERQA